MMDDPKPLPRSFELKATSCAGSVKRHSFVTPSCAQKTFSSWLRKRMGRSWTPSTMRSATFMSACSAAEKTWPFFALESSVKTASRASGATLMMRCWTRDHSRAAFVRSSTTSGRECSFWPASMPAFLGAYSQPAALTARRRVVIERCRSTPYVAFAWEMICKGQRIGFSPRCVTKPTHTDPGPILHTHRYERGVTLFAPADLEQAGGGPRCLVPCAVGPSRVEVRRQGRLVVVVSRLYSCDGARLGVARERRERSSKARAHNLSRRSGGSCDAHCGPRKRRRSC